MRVMCRLATRWIARLVDRRRSLHAARVHVLSGTSCSPSGRMAQDAHCVTMSAEGVARSKM